MVKTQVTARDTAKKFNQGVRKSSVTCTQGEYSIHRPYLVCNNKVPKSNHLTA